MYQKWRVVMQLKNILCLGAIITILAGCSASDPTTKVKPMQRKDKRLSCKEILLEMNEAEFYRQTAYKSKGPKIKNVLMPLGYISTYMDSEEAIDAANARVNYLDRIYEIMNCSEKEDPDVIDTMEDIKNGEGNYSSPYSDR
jgi:hypothetical protein